MKQYSISDILRHIREDFTAEYPQASNFTDTPVYYHCMAVIGNPDDLREIILNNDQKGIPPVQSMLELFQKHCLTHGKISHTDARCMGELMAFLFKYVFGYQKQQDDNPIQNDFNVQTAALFSEPKSLPLIE